MRTPHTLQQNETPALEVDNITVAYGGIVALAPCSASFVAGALHAIAGPNGAGKSSFIKAILSLTQKKSGTVFVNGHAFEKTQHASDYHVSYVPQRSNVILSFPISVFDVVASGMQKPNWKPFRSTKEKKQLQEQVTATLDYFGLSALAHRQIGQLSGGQQQRVFFARALIAKPKVLLLDEPFNGIDMPTSEHLFNALKRDAKDNLTTIVCVHHDIHTLKKFDTVTLINRSIIASGHPEKVLTPEWIQRTYS